MPESSVEVWAIVELMGHVRLAGRLSEEEKFGAKMGRLDIPADVACTICGGSGNGQFNSGPNPTDDPCAACLGGGQVPGFVTQLFGGGSVYRITIVSEAVARHAAKSTRPEPVQAWDFPKQLTAKAVSSEMAQMPDDYDGAAYREDDE